MLPSGARPGSSKAAPQERAMSEDQKAFTVNDRRHFTPSGEAREESVDEPTAAPPGGAGERPPEVSLPPSAATLVGFLLGLAGQGAEALQPTSSEPESAEEKGARLSEARHVISILEMLKEKTEGRRTSEEERVLEGVLYELRMAYLHRTKGTGPA